MSPTLGIALRSTLRFNEDISTDGQFPTTTLIRGDPKSAINLVYFHVATIVYKQTALHLYNV